MDLIDISNQIVKIMGKLDAASKELEIRANDKAEAIAEYDKKIAIYMLEMKAGREFDANGKTVKWESITNAEKIAKGMCEKERYKMELADARYRNLHAGLEILKSQLTALQSLNKTQKEY